MIKSVARCLSFMCLGHACDVYIFWFNINTTAFCFGRYILHLLGHRQCDQIWRFLEFGQLFKAFGNNEFAQISYILRHFCEGVKIFNFSCKIIFGQLL